MHRWLAPLGLLIATANVATGAPVPPADPKPDIRTDPGAGGAVVWYLSHSGVAVRTDKAFLVFDYIRRTARSGGERIDFLDPETFPAVPVYVFVSHAHRDHYDPVIWDWAKRVEGLHYVLSQDVTRSSNYVKAELPARRRTIVGPGERATIHDGAVEVRTVRASDEGVALWVHVDGLDILHTGDHGLWSWKEEDYAPRREEYLAELRQFARLERRPDIAFLCADLRIPGPARLSGAPDAVALLRPRLAFAIHNYGAHREAANALAAAIPDTAVAAVRNHGDAFVYP